MVRCRQCSDVFKVIGDALNLRLDSAVLLEMAAKAIVEQFDLKACHFRVLSRDQQRLEHVACHGLSRAFLEKGPVDAERSVAEAFNGRAVAVLDCVSDPRVQYPEAFSSEGIVSMLTVPLETRGQVIGRSDPPTSRTKHLERTVSHAAGTAAPSGFARGLRRQAHLIVCDGVANSANPRGRASRVPGVRQV